MRLNAAALVELGGGCGGCEGETHIKAEMNMNVIERAEQCCNQAGSSCQDVCGGACVTEG